MTFSYRLILSYRGARYAGWQRQENALTVQEILETALGKVLGGPSDGARVRVDGSSRTDAGVHARGQVASLHLESPFAERGLVHGTNHHLPEDVRVLAAHRMPPGFHARKHALGKTYSYRLSRAAVISPLDAAYTVRVPREVDSAPMAAAAEQLIGRHDFTAFALAGGSHGQPFRTITAAGWEERGEELLFRVTGDGFLRGMVRALVGTLIEVGIGRRSPGELAALLAGAPRESAGPTAPAHGLVLEEVFYPPEWNAGWKESR
jgi:tRNA pseudouridine38-40 synthase